MQLSLASAFRHAQCTRRLRVAEAIDTDQHEDVARALRQRRDGALEIERRRPAVGIGAVRQSARRLADPVPVPQPAPAGNDGADGDTLQPGRETTALLEAPKSPPRRHERLLNAVLGRFTLAGEPKA